MSDNFADNLKKTAWSVAAKGDFNTRFMINGNFGKCQGLVFRSGKALCTFDMDSGAIFFARNFLISAAASGKGGEWKTDITKRVQKQVTRLGEFILRMDDTLRPFIVISCQDGTFEFPIYPPSLNFAKSDGVNKSDIAKLTIGAWADRVARKMDLLEIITHNKDGNNGFRGNGGGYNGGNRSGGGYNGGNSGGNSGGGYNGGGNSGGGNGSLGGLDEEDF